jgi:subtilase family serine protease
MHKRTVRRLGIVAAASVAVTTAAATAAAPATATTSDVPHAAPAWTAHAKPLSTPGGSSATGGRIYLSPRGGLGHLAKVATAMATPGSATYHKFLTASEYNSRFAPTSADVSAVSGFLRANGLTVTQVGAANRFIAFRGAVAAVNRAFSTRLLRYYHAGTSVQAPSTAIRVPGNIGSTVLAVTGLDTTPQVNKPNLRVQPPAGFRNARPCSIFYGQVAAKFQADNKTPLPQFKQQLLDYAPCGYTGPQYRAAYEGSSSLHGTGVTVAITDAYGSSTIVKDSQRYAGLNGDGSYASGQYQEKVAKHFTNKKLCDPSGWSSEETLDVEAVHAMAPGANIRYYGAASCLDSDLLDSLAQVVQDNTAQLVTNSWGDVEQNETPDNVQAYEAVFLQGGVQGISFMFSSGDNGDELANTGIRQADYPTSDPYVTAVGGTSAAIGSSGALSFETGWGTIKYSLSPNGKSWNKVGFLYGAGGGPSHLFNQPAYQAGFAAGPYRQVPDVAMDADPNTGMLIGQTQTFPDGVYYDQYRIGGTSLASPLFAGITALALQNAGGGAGLLNPAIYANPSAFNDVTPVSTKGDVRVDFANGVDASNGLLYSVRTFNQDSSLKTKSGWDDVTGLGTASPRWIGALASTG